MTIQEWNALRPGDLIRYIEHPDIRYRVHALGEEVDLSKDLTNPLPMMSRDLWIDRLLSRDDPLYPDYSIYEPGDAKDFELDSVLAFPTPPILTVFRERGDASGQEPPP